MNRLSPFILSLLIFVACTSPKQPGKTQIEQWKKEIIAAEESFAKAVQEKGMHDAFVAFAADSAVIMRQDSIIKGKQNIDVFYNGRNSKNLSWKPDFVEVSKSGDLGYTYGKYTYNYTDSLGKIQTSTGIFHTVWKKDNAGNWKFVWD